MNRKWLTILIVAGAALLVIAGMAYAVLSARGGIPRRPTPTPTMRPLPTLNITPPPSLSDLADDYPELADILNDPELDSVYKEFLVAYQEGGEEAALELARQRGLLTPEGDIRFTLVLDTEESAPLVEQLESIGVTVVSAYRDRVNVSVPMALVQAQMDSEEPAAIFGQLTELEHVIAVRLPQERTSNGSTIPGEGVALTGAESWHDAGFTGAGVRIGVLDLGFAGHQSLLGQELPESVPIQTFGWVDQSEVHGTACAEIIHEMAPDAELVFAWYDGTDATFGQAIDWLLAQGVNIISNSTGGVVGPHDGTEWDAQQVDRVAAQGVLWVNSSGNEATSHYRATFTDTDGDGLHETAAGQESVALKSWGSGSVRVILQWTDDWDQPTQDYNLFLYDENGNLLASSQDFQSGQQGQEPAEWIEVETDLGALFVVISAANVNRPAEVELFVQGADVIGATPQYSLVTPGDAVGSLTVGAANWWDDSLADYSSQGPTTDGRLKPELSAPTGVSGATYGNRAFDGTSASCPHVSGAAALVWQANPTFTRQQVVDYLLTNARDLGPAGPDTGYGYGRLQLPTPPGVIAEPLPSPLPVLTPIQSPAPLPPPTPVAFVTPAPGTVNIDLGSGGELLTWGVVGLLLGGVGCLGALLLLAGGIGLIIARRGRRRPPQRPPRGGRPSGPPFVPHARPPQPPPSSGYTPTVLGGPSRRCPACGAPVRSESRFCPNCGQPLE
jgi:subtilisin family serine protease